ncbi:hypothetical protein A4X13_0g9404 [Tilletia indica]|uniref:Uncharacterized protein n=1 Tax=Tilletia indica TaxID=43049 RepID=A0A177T112_9BASI|nr:hypothetical protein A4X13_0g9404 [Tilletia indica]
MKGSIISMLMIASVSASRLGLEDEFAHTEGHSLPGFQQRRTVSSEERSVNSLADSTFIEKRLDRTGIVHIPAFIPHEGPAPELIAPASALERLKAIGKTAGVVTAIGAPLLGAGALGFYLSTRFPIEDPARRSALVTVDTDTQAKRKAHDPLSNPAKAMMVDVQARDELSKITKVLVGMPLGLGAIALGWYLGIVVPKPHHHHDHTPQGP